MNPRQELGLRIRELRLKHNFTQEKLGELCNLSYKYLGNIERGRENPTFEVLLKIAHGLQVEAWELLVFEHTYNGEKQLKRELKELVSETDLEQLQKAVKIIRALTR